MAEKPTKPPKRVEYVIKYEGTPPSYYAHMTGIGPAFGAKLDETHRFASRESALHAINTWPIGARPMCVVETAPARKPRTLKYLTKHWAWPMWLGLAIWRARAKARWERVVMAEAQSWMRGWVPTASDIEYFLQYGLREEFANEERRIRDRAYRARLRTERSQAAKRGWEKRRARAKTVSA